MKEYKKRIADKMLKSKLDANGAVLIQGPKWCGKTTTAKQMAGSVIYMHDPKNKEQNISLAKIDPQLILSGKTPRLIDEWQLAPSLWDAVRFEVDQRDEFGQFILTGSAVPADQSKISHSGIGRIAKLTMRPMSLFESLDSNGSISLLKMFERTQKLSAISELDIAKIAFLVCRGGWPKSIDQVEKIALQQVIDYCHVLIDSDITSVDNVSRNPERVRLLLRSYARNSASQASIPTIKKDMLSNDSDRLDEDTITSYINALKKLFVIEDSPAWNPNLRSKTAIRTSDTRYFVDPSIACASLGIGPQDLINDLNTFGLLFETLCIRDLRIYAESIDGELYHYRDRNGLECDAVIHLRNGKWAAVEIKLGDFEIDQAAKNLLKLKNQIDHDKMNQPSFLMVVSGTKYAYQREDGVFVVPIGCLKE